MELTANRPAENRPRRGGRGRGSGEASQEGGSSPGRGQRKGLPKAPPEDAPTGLLVDYLKRRQVIVYEASEDAPANEAYEHLARHMGTHFQVVAPFYEKMKRIVATGRGSRKVDVEGMTEAERSAAVQLGTLLHRHGLLKDFYYHRSPKRQLRVIPTSDGETAQFLTGGWLELYVAWLLTRELQARMSPSRYQVLYNVKGTLPDGSEFEADLMAAVDGRMMWMECKTGQWQDYSARFRGRVKTFGCDRKSAALLLIRPPDPSIRSRATDLLDMTVLTLKETPAFIDRFLEVSPNGRGAAPERERSGRRSRAAAPAAGEDAAPARTAAAKEGAPEAGGTELRRRRRRRGRGRRGSSAPVPPDGAAPAVQAPERPQASGRPAKPPEGGETSGRPPRPRVESPFARPGAGPGAAPEADPAPSGDDGSVRPAGGPTAPSGEAPSGGAHEAAGRPRRRRRRSGARPEGAAGAGEAPSAAGAQPDAGSPEKAKAAAPEKEETGAPEKAKAAAPKRGGQDPVSESARSTEARPPKPKKSASGVTIAPDLAAMIAPQDAGRSRD